MTCFGEWRRNTLRRAKFRNWEERNMADKHEPEKIKDLPKKEKDRPITEEELGGVAGGMEKETGPFGAKTDGNPESASG
jgi:hypothetical protein